MVYYLSQFRGPRSMYVMPQFKHTGRGKIYRILVIFWVEISEQWNVGIIKLWSNRWTLWLNGFELYVQSCSLVGNRGVDRERK